MEFVIAWAGFVGAWLLVLGPVYQASVELREENIDRDDVTSYVKDIEPPAPISPLWWLLPPVAFLKSRRRKREWREAVMRRLPDSLILQFVQFTEKAMGWLLVAGGAFFIAVKETWELHELSHWPVWLFWVSLPVMLLVTLGFTVYRSYQSAHVLERRHEREGSTDAERIEGSTGQAS